MNGQEGSGSSLTVRRCRCERKHLRASRQAPPATAAAKRSCAGSRSPAVLPNSGPRDTILEACYAGLGLRARTAVTNAGAQVPDRQAFVPLAQLDRASASGAEG